MTARISVSIPYEIIQQSRPDPRSPWNFPFTVGWLLKFSVGGKEFGKLFASYPSLEDVEGAVGVMVNCLPANGEWKTEPVRFSYGGYTDVGHMPISLRSNDPSFAAAQAPKLDPKAVTPIFPTAPTKLDERETKEVRFAQEYVSKFNHGTPGSLDYITIDKLAKIGQEFADSRLLMNNRANKLAAAAEGILDTILRPYDTISAHSYFGYRDELTLRRNVLIEALKSWESFKIADLIGK